jgi:hypothetical protein
MDVLIFLMVMIYLLAVPLTIVVIKYTIDIIQLILSDKHTETWLVNDKRIQRNDESKDIYYLKVLNPNAKDSLEVPVKPSVYNKAYIGSYYTFQVGYTKHGKAINASGIVKQIIGKLLIIAYCFIFEFGIIGAISQILHESKGVHLTSSEMFTWNIFTLAIILLILYFIIHDIINKGSKWQTMYHTETFVIKHKYTKRSKIKNKDNTKPNNQYYAEVEKLPDYNKSHTNKKFTVELTEEEYSNYNQGNQITLNVIKQGFHKIRTIIEFRHYNSGMIRLHLIFIGIILVNTILINIFCR